MPTVFFLNSTVLITGQNPPQNAVYGAFPLTASSSTQSNGSGAYVDQPIQYAQYLAPPQHYQNVPSGSQSPVDQDGSQSPGKLDVRMSGHARAVSLPASVVMQSTGASPEQANGQYEVDQLQRMYGLGLEASE
jgi:hypothetical protein